MKLSCLPVSLFDDFRKGKRTILDWVEQGKKLGLDGIDISSLMLEPVEKRSIPGLGHTIQAMGMRVAMFTTYTDFTHPDKAVREEQLDKLRRDTEAAAAVGAELIRITAGQDHPGVKRERLMDWACDGLYRASLLCRRYGVEPVVENHGRPNMWEFTDFTGNRDNFVSIMSRLEGTNIGINFDTANPVIHGYDPVVLLKETIGRVKSIHAADNSVYGGIAPVVVGKGIVPFAEILEVLSDSEFDGWICIEESSGTRDAGISEAVSFLQRSIDGYR